MGSKPANKVTQTNKVELSPEQKQIYDIAFPYAKEYAQSDVQLYPGSGIAGFNELETLGQQLALQGGAAGQALGNTALNTNQFLLDPALLSPDSNPYLKASGTAAADELTRQLTQSILPSIRNSATAAGGVYSGGSTREGVAQGLAVDATTRNIGDTLAKMYSDAYQGGLSTLGSALKTAPITQAGSLFGAQIASGVGAQQRSMEQAILDEALQRFYTEQSLPLMRAQELIGLTTSMPGGTGVSTVQAATPKVNPWMQAAGTAIGMLPMLAMMI